MEDEEFGGLGDGGVQHRNLRAGRALKIEDFLIGFETGKNCWN